MNDHTLSNDGVATSTVGWTFGFWNSPEPQGVVLVKVRAAKKVCMIASLLLVLKCKILRC